MDTEWEGTDHLSAVDREGWLLAGQAVRLYAAGGFAVLTRGAGESGLRILVARARPAAPRRRGWCQVPDG